MLQGHQWRRDSVSSGYDRAGIYVDLWVKTHQRPLCVTCVDRSLRITVHRVTPLPQHTPGVIG